jgi:hypothetical protein
MIVTYAGWDAVDAAASGAWHDRRAGSPVSDRTARRRPALKRLAKASTGCTWLAKRLVEVALLVSS